MILIIIFFFFCTGCILIYICCLITCRVAVSSSPVTVIVDVIAAELWKTLMSHSPH